MISEENCEPNTGRFSSRTPLSGALSTGWDPKHRDYSSTRNRSSELLLRCPSMVLLKPLCDHHHQGLMPE